MTQEDRLLKIKQMLKNEKHLRTRNLARFFNISFDTARRDVVRLTSTGQAIRVHGGLIAIDENEVPNFLTRNQIDSPIKIKMAQMARRFVHPNQCDFIGPSTTLKKLCELICGTDLQIVTNSIDNSLALMQTKLPSVRLLGGKIDKEHRFNYSVTSLDLLHRISFNTAFIGTSNVKDDGIYSAKMSDSELIKTACSRAKQVIVVAEKYKFDSENSSPYMSIPLNEIDVLITDLPLSEKFQKNFSPKTQIISVLRK